MCRPCIAGEHRIGCKGSSSGVCTALGVQSKLGPGVPPASALASVDIPQKEQKGVPRPFEGNPGLSQQMSSSGNKFDFRSKDCSQYGGPSNRTSTPPSRGTVGRVLLLVTTHLSEDHLWTLQHCWPEVSGLSLIRGADILLAVNIDADTRKRMQMILSVSDDEGIKAKLSEMMHSALQGKAAQIWVEMMPNPGYQAGAMLAFQVGTRCGWWNGYDWVVRVNPDVIIRNDKWLTGTMARSDVDAIVVDCSKGTHAPPNFHTDFSVFRPQAVHLDAFLRVSDNSEHHYTAGIQPIVNAGRHRELPGYDDPRWECRVRGQRSPVIHDHSFIRNKTCPPPI